MIKPTTNIPAIKKILNHPKVNGWLKDDRSPVVYEPIIHPNIIYLMNDEKTAVIRIDPLNSVSCQVHMAALPEFWGNGRKMVMDALKWGFKNTGYHKVQAFIPGHNPYVLALVQRCYFKEEGVLKKSFLINGKLEDQKVFGLTKEDFEVIVCQ